jgi:energy-coupling factor transport system ATP-binding protein
MIGEFFVMHEVITIKDTSFKYPNSDSKVIHDLNLPVYKGEWLAVVGHNGSGKSTMAKLLNGLLMPQEGTVIVGGYDTQNETDIWEIRRQVGIVFQNPDNQFVGSTVRDDIAFGLENNGIERSEMIERIENSASRVNMNAYLDYEPHNLSGGQKQRVAIAGILAQKPSIIVLDEATSMLDPIGRKDVIATVKELQEKEGITVISITHDLEEAIRADRVVVFKEGTIVKQGTPLEVFQDEKLVKGAGLDIPFSMKVSNLLKNKGIEIGKVTLTQEELVNELWKYKQKV